MNSITLEAAQSPSIKQLYEVVNIGLLSKLTNYQSQREDRVAVEVPEMKDLSIDVSRDFMATIINGLQVQPRAEIVRRHYLEHQPPSRIAQDLNLSPSRVEYHLKIFRLLMIKSLRQLQDENCLKGDHHDPSDSASTDIFSKL
ncbi:sigma-70 family RNA polymerase sigma factor [Pseudobacteriovorax antillogorgiicola]|uniref:Uncharacterized protein n=1 Tax=Pseudobacteriovorax antillogorgiicola TaxID=1513793 RepID=A0A1Y6BLJ1_9BACT|nr:sigma-70 family RNA polymerase sigma factor [Pseudobacteriovorax antillogorgiicola]TCS54588.1 hypothetical protein EDD56_106101 [Pseudobacteriovorax antillogorgiicola]SMF17800.1 hypothetical protein SAMN06296036_106142 [Pseudobacteriovorax antillogorgiicola]